MDRVTENHRKGIADRRCFIAATQSTERLKADRNFSDAKPCTVSALKKMNYVKTVFFGLFFLFFCTSNSAERTFSAVSTPPIARNGVSFPVQSLPIDVQKRNRHPGRTAVPRPCQLGRALPQLVRREPCLEKK